MDTHLDELINRWREGKLSDEELHRLTDALATQEGRAALRGDWFMEAALPEALRTSPVLKLAQKMDPMVTPLRTESKRWTSWLSWRPLTAAAAGLVIGAFSATAVWAIASGNSPRVHECELPLVDGSFEQTAQVRQSRPLLKNVWHGDPAEIVGTVGRVSPHGGAHMLRFLASAIAEDEREKRDAADMWQILDVPEGGPHRVRVRAWFASDAGADTSFVVMATALSCGLDEVNSAWGARFDGDPRVLSASAKTTIVRSSDASWHLCELVLDVPQGTRLLVLDVAGRKVSGMPAAAAFPGQFVDDVSVSIADEPALP